MDYLYIDIETVPTQSEEVQEYLRAQSKAPSNLKDPEKIEAAKVTAANKAVENTVFDGWFGHCVCIGYAMNDDEPSTLYGDERESLVGLFSLFSNHNRPVIVGHHAAGFDIPFLTRRAVSLGVELPASYLWPRDPRPWDDKIHDTMIMAAGTRDTISLDKLCFAMGIPGKGDMNGGKVYEAWLQGEYEKISDYCADDVRRVRSVHKKFLQAGW